MIRTVCVFCSSSARIAEEHLQLAARVGTGLGRRGWGLVSGGGSVSMMGALARAARAAGAPTVGVIPAALERAEVADRDSDELLITPDMRTRKAEMDRRADAFLALPGGLGTLEELLEVWTARTLGLHDKPVVVCDPGQVLSPLRTLVEHLTDGGFVRSSAAAALVWAPTVESALDACAARCVPSQTVPPTDLAETAL